jgi:hypothetical protein
MLAASSEGIRQGCDAHAERFREFAEASTAAQMKAGKTVYGLPECVLPLLFHQVILPAEPDQQFIFRLLLGENLIFGG